MVLAEATAGRLRLTLTDTVTQTVWRNDEEDPKGRLTVLVNSVVGVFSIEAIRPQFIKRRFHVVDFKETTLLSWNTTILRESDLYTIPA